MRRRHRHPDRGLHKAFGSTQALDGLDLDGHDRRGARLPRPERGRQVHHHPRAARPAPRRRRHGPAVRRRPVARCGRAAPPARLRARRREPVADAHRRRGHRPARPTARRARRAPTRRPDRAVRARPHEEGPRLLQGQPPEGRPRGRAGVRRRAPAARRADLGPRPADGGGLHRVHRRLQGRGPHGAAEQPHPGRGRAALRPGEHHPIRPRRRDRHPGRPAAPHPHVRLGRGRRPAHGPRRPGRRARPRRRGPPGAVRGRHRPPRRGASTRSAGSASARSPASRRRSRSCSCATTATTSHRRACGRCGGPA